MLSTGGLLAVEEGLGVVCTWDVAGEGTDVDFYPPERVQVLVS